MLTNGAGTFWDIKYIKNKKYHIKNTSNPKHKTPFIHSSYHTEMDLMWIMDLNVKPQTIKLLCDLELEADFLNRTQTA